MRCLSGTPPGLPVARQVVVRCKSGSIEHQRSCNRRELISTGRQTHEVPIKRMSRHSQLGPFLFQVPSKFCVCSKLATRLIQPHLTRNAFHCMSPDDKHTSNVCELIQTIENRCLRLTSVDAIRQGVTAKKNNT